MRRVKGALAVTLLCAGLSLSVFASGGYALAAETRLASSHAAGAGVKEWTVMVYVNARNNLEHFGLRDVNEMESVGSDGNVNIVVELARIAGEDPSDGDWRGSRRYLIVKDADPGKINSPVLEEFWDADMGDWRHLADFGVWARANFPARHYLLIVWNHGSGWKHNAAGKDISFDDVTGGRISTPELGEALRRIGKVDVYASDACLMQTVEVPYEIRDYADVIVQSQATEPAAGYKYDRFLSALRTDPAVGAETMGRYIVDSYCEYYQGLVDPSTQSALRVAELPRFAALLDEWAALMRVPEGKELVRAARKAAVHFQTPSNRDIYGMAAYLAVHSGDPRLARKSAEVASFIKDRLVSANCAVGPAYAGVGGLSVYFPDAGYNKKYDALAFARETGWDEFLKWFR